MPKPIAKTAKRQTNTLEATLAEWEQENQQLRYELDEAKRQKQDALLQHKKLIDERERLEVKLSSVQKQAEFSKSKRTTTIILILLAIGAGWLLNGYVNGNGKGSKAAADSATIYRQQVVKLRQDNQKLQDSCAGIGELTTRLVAATGKGEELSILLHEIDYLRTENARLTTKLNELGVKVPRAAPPPAPVSTPAPKQVPTSVSVRPPLPAPHLTPIVPAATKQASRPRQRHGRRSGGHTAQEQPEVHDDINP